MDTALVRFSSPSPRLVDAFLHCLDKSSLLTEGQLASVLRAAAGKSVDELSAQLIEQELLTPYQAQRLLDGEPRGLILGPYVVLDELGQGGFGRVYKAVHTIMKRVVALKIISPKWVADPEVRGLFLREIVLVTRLTHTNVALAYDANEHGDVLYLAMEYVDGPTLEDFVTERGPLPVPFGCAVLRQVAQALQYTSENGVLHRDLKPANLLLPGAEALVGRPAGAGAHSHVLVKVIDFGLARLYPRGPSQAVSITRDGDFIGTPHFVSPEQARGCQQIDIRSDLYSLGCTFYYAFTGQYPFQGTVPLDVIAQRLQTDPPPLTSLRSNIPSPVALIIHRLMARNPEHRFQTPAELLDALSFTIGTLAREEYLAPGPLPVPPHVLGDHARPSPFGSPDRDEEAPRTHDKASEEPEAPCSHQAAGTAKSAGEPFPVLWREWVAVLERLLRGRSPEWSESAYKILYGALLGALRNGNASTSEVPAPLLARLEVLVEPWVNLRSITQLDRPALLGLWQSCRELDAELPSRGRGRFSSWLVFLFCALGVASVSAFLFW